MPRRAGISARLAMTDGYGRKAERWKEEGAGAREGDRPRRRGIIGDRTREKYALLAGFPRYVIMIHELIHFKVTNIPGASVRTTVSASDYIR